MTVNRRIDIDITREYASLYSMRWEIERTFSTLEDILQCENIWYIRNIDYETAIDFKKIAYNLIVISNTEAGEMPEEIMKIVDR